MQSSTGGSRRVQLRNTEQEMILNPSVTMNNAIGRLKKQAVAQKTRRRDKKATAAKARPTPSTAAYAQRHLLDFSEAAGDGFCDAGRGRPLRGRRGWGHLLGTAPRGGAASSCDERRLCGAGRDAHACQKALAALRRLLRAASSFACVC